MARCRKRRFPNPDARNEMKRISLWACGCVAKIKAGSDPLWTQFLRAGTLSVATFALVNCTAISAISAWTFYQRQKGWFALNCFSIQPNAPAVISSSTVSIRFLG
jgi:hypothetical protein